MYRNLRPSTANSYRKVVNRLISIDGEIYPQDLTDEKILEWRHVVLRTAKEITWNGYVRHMRSLFNFGIEYKLLEFDKNPFVKMSIRSGIEKRKTLTLDQLEKIDKFLASDYLLPDILLPRWFIVCLVNTFRYTGIRRSQLVKLRIKDIDLENRTIIIPSRINKTHNYHEIPVSDKLYPYLERIIQEMKLRYRKDEDQLFNFNVVSKHTRKKHRNMTIDQVSHLFRVLSENIGFKVSAHRFRHTIATNLMRNINNVYLVKQLLGHSDIKVTLSYIEYSPDMLRDCVNSL